MARVLVTGGAGFIGSHVADAYAARGDAVWVVDDLSHGRRERVPEAARFAQLGVGDPGVEDVFRDAGGFDVVNHHAAQVDVRQSVADPRRDAEINIAGLLNILECAVRHGAGRVVFVSSGGVIYGEPGLRPTPEAAPKLPLSPYGVSKLASEYYLYYYHRVRGLDYVALRYANVYGPRQDPHGEAGVVAIFSQRIMAGEGVTVYGDGEQTRDYVYVADVVSANLAASAAVLPAASTLDERAYNIGTGQETTVNELAARLMVVAERAVPIEFRPERAGELRRSCLDVTRGVKLGWAPRVPLEAGLRATYAHLASAVAWR